jgi:cyclopropane fatty-acyl-phospholipid synthase-like methyltransferase
MNIYLKKFIKEKFKKPGTALDLGAGDFFDVACLKQLGWKCEGVDIKTGVNLEKYYLSKKRPFDLVFSNYVIHKIQNKEQFIKTVFDNLKKDGWFFIHTFDKKDKHSKSNLTANDLRKMLSEQGFKDIKTKVFSYYDNEDGHKHWHKILEVTGKK